MKQKYKKGKIMKPRKMAQWIYSVGRESPDVVYNQCHVGLSLYNKSFHGNCRRYRWHMPWILLANAIDIAGKCHR